MHCMKSEITLDNLLLFADGSALEGEASDQGFL